MLVTHDVEKIEKFNLLKNIQTPKCEDFQIPVDVWIKENLVFLNEFVEFANSLKDLLGLAANQVAFHGKRIKSRFFVYRIKKDAKAPFEIVIDPKIEAFYGDPVDETEGCLSWPGKTILGKRYLKIKVSYTNIRGEKIETDSLDRYQSHVWQHEMDHINGVQEKFFDGHGPYKYELPKVGRNDPCPCGKKDDSGKPIKYKKCCGKDR